jgi:hypothetical protein
MWWPQQQAGTRPCDGRKNWLKKGVIEMAEKLTTYHPAAAVINDKNCFLHGRRV